MEKVIIVENKYASQCKVFAFNGAIYPEDAEELGMETAEFEEEVEYKLRFDGNTHQSQHKCQKWFHQTVDKGWFPDTTPSSWSTFSVALRKPERYRRSCCSAGSIVLKRTSPAWSSALLFNDKVHREVFREYKWCSSSETDSIRFHHHGNSVHGILRFVQLAWSLGYKEIQNQEDNHCYKYLHEKYIALFYDDDN